MKSFIKWARSSILLAFSFILLIACKNDDDQSVVILPEAKAENEINDFVWKGLNKFYLWKDDVSNLADDRFSSDTEFNNFLNSHETPEDIFESLLYERGTVDKNAFSRITNDLTDLKSARLALSESNGVNFAIGNIANSNDVFGVVQYITNNSDASEKDIKRGDIFLKVNGQQLTRNNIDNLLFNNNTYTLSLGAVIGGSIFDIEKTIELTKSPIEENPILMSNIFELTEKKIGYIIYNEFNADFDTELNDLFGDFKAQGITDLILDLRYNSGGDVFSAVHLSSMVTGQFTGELLMQEQWNNEYQKLLEETNPSALKNNFTDKFIGRSSDTPINSLNLSEVYILTTKGSASASELVINCLKPYINVVQIGDKTFGKYVGSVALFDSPNFTKENVNPNHTYAMQPITFKVINANGVSDYFNGLNPTIEIIEDITNYGVLGNPDEPLLAKALSLITGQTSKNSLVKNKTVDFNIIADSKDFTFLGKNMYLDKPVIGYKN